MEAGLYDETLVVLTSDHGEAFGEHGYRWHAKTLFEELVRVPLIIRRPGEDQPGRRIAAPVQLVDIAPTLLDAAGLAIPEELEGQVLPPRAEVGGARASQRAEFGRTRCRERTQRGARDAP